ncbi:ThiF family adenylyltransferase [Streptomyces sp. MST-110588]|uniref:ThiF family adenylyltransferase n=1 Tax=Streptomyces sp. MST-110588 TaxID=2833628 RepID=UPI001F5DBF13|nr:ThiF family adenylyltransferase [Streptomyces sp. MST-110588]UNO40037.1 ThiF family adenylyltransferase [Streptomyces sp. MST-110588]
MLKPALRRGWRDRETVRFGVAPAHAVVVGPLDTATGSFLELIDGTRTVPQLARAAEAMGLTADHARGVVERLGRAGLLDAPAAGGTAAEEVRADDAAFGRLRPDLASLSVQHPEAAGGLDRVGARRSVRARVRGAGRVGAAVAALLSAAGVGQVEVLDGGRVEPWDVHPAGVRAERIGERRDTAARRLVQHSSPWTRRPRPQSGPPGPPGEPGEPGLALVVLAPRDGLAAYAPDPVLSEPLLTAGIPHLYAGVVEGTGVVGPLVLPGSSSCARCHELRRTDQEPAWPRLLAQWRSGRRSPAVPACDAALATMVAGLAATQALAFLDGRLPPCTGARMEWALPCAGWETTGIVPHPECDCGAAVPAGAGHSSDPGARHATMSE